MAEIHASLPAKERSEVYVGKYIIVGLTYLDADGTFLRVDQRHGVIVMVETAGIGIALKGDHDGETLSVPLDLPSRMRIPANMCLRQRTKSSSILT